MIPSSFATDLALTLGAVSWNVSPSDVSFDTYRPKALILEGLAFGVANLKESAKHGMEPVISMNLEDLKIRAALEPDLEDVISLLIDEDLNIEGVHENIGNFVVALDGEDLVGCGGAEAFQFVALIRSVAVHPDHRSNGVGRRIVREMLDRLSSRGLREFYLVTENAEGWFRKRGFKPCDRDEVHPQVLASTEFAHAPEEAVVMRLQMLT